MTIHAWFHEPLHLIRNIFDLFTSDIVSESNLLTIFCQTEQTKIIASTLCFYIMKTAGLIMSLQHSNYFYKNITTL